MDSKNEEVSTKGSKDRIKKSWIPLVAVAGAFTSFLSAAFRTRPEPPNNNIRAENTGAAKATGSATQPGSAALKTEIPYALSRKYTLTAVLGEEGSAHPFRYSLADIAVGAEDSVYCLGDDEIRQFDSDGAFVRRWDVKPKAACMAVGPDGSIYIGFLGRVDIYSPRGEYTDSIAVGDVKKQGAVTAIKVLGNEILVADIAAKIIRRYDTSGKQIGIVGDNNKTGSFMLPNRWLDFDIDSYGTVWATDTGRHRVTGWALDGSPIADFGKFGMQDPADFVGCCNPVNLAVAPNGNIVTAEKMISRVKIFDQEGVLLAVIGPEYFDPKCTNLHLAVDSKGRILAADPMRREIKIFSPVAGE